MKLHMHIFKKSIIIVMLFTLKLVANQDIASDTIHELPSGNKQFYTGLGLAIGGMSFSIIGIWALSSVRPDSMAYGPRDIYGVPFDSTEITDKFVIGFGAVLLASGVGLNAFGIPLLIKGSRLKKEKEDWINKNKISLQLSIRKEIFSLKTIIYF
jgi:hypothetical protein